MLTVAAALEAILQQSQSLPAEMTPLTPAALGWVLAEDVASDLDMPPHDKALMDGYAVRAADLPEGQGDLAVIEEITAGRAPTKAVQAGQASRIMTGAPLPAGADAVIQVERTQMLDDGRVRIADRPPRRNKTCCAAGGRCAGVKKSWPLGRGCGPRNSACWPRSGGRRCG